MLKKTTGGNYTYIAQRYEWLAGVFKALGLPAGSGPAAFTVGQEPRAGAIYYDSLGVDAGLYIWTGLTWSLVSGAIPTFQQVLTTGSILTGNNTVNGGGFNFLFDDNRQFNINSRSATGDTIVNFEFNPVIGQSIINMADLTNTTSFTFRPESAAILSPLISLSTDNLYFNGSLPSSVSVADSMLVWNPTSKQVSIKAVGSSGSIGEWDGSVTGTTFSATSTTINSGAVQWTFTGSSPATFTLPARTSSVNQFYLIKNIGSDDLTVAAAGTDDIYTTTTVSSFIVGPGESVMVNGAANGTSDLWTALFHSGVSSNIRVASEGEGELVWYERTADTTLILKPFHDTTFISWHTRPDSSIYGLLDTAGLYAASPNNGTVTSVAMTVPSFLSVAGSPVTTSGTLAVTLSGTALPVANGGTGSTTQNFVDLTTTQASIGGAKTWTAAHVFSSSLTAGPTVVGTTGSSSSGSQYLVQGAGSTSFRAVDWGSTSVSIGSSNRNFGSFIVGDGTVVEHTSGTHPLIASFIAKPQTITIGAASTTNTATVYIDNEHTATVTGDNYALWVNAGNTRIGGDINIDRTITAGGTTGNQTINQMSGTVNVAASGTTVTVTNSFVTANSIVYAVIRTNDATATIKNVVPAAGSFTINLGAAATAETSIGFLVTN